MLYRSNIMAESNEQNDLNMFREGMDLKNIDKEPLHVEKNENDEDRGVDSSIASIAFEIDEDIAGIQAIAVMAASKTVDGASNNAEEVKPSNLEIEAALSNTFEDTVQSDRRPRTECQVAGYIAEKMAEEARRVVAMGEDLMETLTSTIEVLHSHVKAFSEKAVEADELGTESGYRTADFYHTMTSKYEANVVALERRARKVQVALSRCEEATNECRRYSALAEDVSDETLDESKRIKFSACWWINKGKAAIIVTLQKERAALLMMKRMWLNVRDDMENEELHNRTSEETISSDEEAQQCENRDRKTKIGHAVATMLGIALLSVTTLFPPGSDSFKAILALGLLTTVWCAVYWSVKFYKCLMEHDKEMQTVVQTADDDHRDLFLENCERRLQIVTDQLANYNVILDSDAESDSGSWETIREETIREETPQ